MAAATTPSATDRSAPSKNAIKNTWGALDPLQNAAKAPDQSARTGEGREHEEAYVSGNVRVTDDAQYWMQALTDRAQRHREIVPTCEELAYAI